MLSHTHTFQVEFGDCDPAQLVYYPNYFAWFDMGMWHLLRSVGLNRHTLRSKYDVIGTPIVKANAEFRAAASDGDMLQIQTRVVRLGTHSFVLVHEIRREDITIVEGSETRVWVARKSDEPLDIRAVPIPPDVRALFSDE